METIPEVDEEDDDDSLVRKNIGMIHLMETILESDDEVSGEM
jgi:hypothetical protein